MGAYDRFQQDGSWSSQGDCPHLLSVCQCLTGLAADERSQLLSAAPHLPPNCPAIAARSPGLSSSQPCWGAGVYANLLRSVPAVLK